MIFCHILYDEQRHIMLCVLRNRKEIVGGGMSKAGLSAFISRASLRSLSGSISQVEEQPRISRPLLLSDSLPVSHIVQFWQFTAVQLLMYGIQEVSLWAAECLFYSWPSF